MPRIVLLLALISAAYATQEAAPECPSVNGIICDGHGTCVDNGDLKVCQCDRGYGGSDCTATGCSDPNCGGHGTCQDPATTPGVAGNMAFCECDSGWSGDDCTTDAASCNPPCVDTRGTCSFGVCECTPEYAGATCSDFACGLDQKCSDHGTCDQSPGLAQFKCTCTEGWQGRSCDAPSIPCEDPTCGGNGQCDNQRGFCICNKGFAGHDCKQEACPNKCGADKKKGACVDNARCLCNEGWTGEGCAFKECPNNCGGHGACTLSLDDPDIAGICMCEEGFNGADCMSDSCPDNCNGHGDCKDAGDGKGKMCQCAKGFLGAGCLECDASVHCTSHGTCLFEKEEPRCQCYGGFSGGDCSLASCPVGSPPGKKAAVCSGQGDCERGIETGQYACVCRPGYGTVDCHAVCPMSTGKNGKMVVCSGQGYCADGSEKGDDGYGVGACFCEEGFTGDDCSETACIKSAPLDGSSGARMCGGIGQGVCVKSLCYCRAGFEPPFCNKQSCPNDCSGNGVCDEKGKCACDSGFGGDDCAEPSCCDPKCNGHGECQAGRCHCEEDFFGPGCADDRTTKTAAELLNKTKICDELHRCYGRGECDPETKTCFCDDGFYGNECEKKRCLKGCGGRGTCNDNGICECEEGYAGKFCGKRSCPNDCNGRGYCINGTCFCRSGWEGVGCDSRSCPSNCNSMGVCKAGICACLNGFSGEDCGIAPCPGYTGLLQCSGHGICDNQKCTCTGRHPDPFDEPLWTGVGCADKTCPSGIEGEISACSGHGTCSNDFRGFCACKNGWKDVGCQSKTCLSNCHGHGTCDYTNPDHPVCNCQKGYESDDCSFISCDWDPVLNEPKPGCHDDIQPPHGLCGSNGTCYCKAGFAGEFCEQAACLTCGALDKCLHRCSDVGKCENGKCLCNEGFTGEDCSTKVVKASLLLQLDSGKQQTREVHMNNLVMSEDRRVSCRSGCAAKHGINEESSSSRWLCMSRCVERTPDPRVVRSSQQLLQQ